MELTYTTAMTADVTDLAHALGIGVATADVDTEQRARKLAANHGFLKGLMMRVGKHFQAAGTGAWRILKSGGVWFGLLSACVSAVMFLFEARNLRHYGQQPLLGKLRVLSVGAAFGAFIMTFLGFFKKIAMAWRNESEDDQDKRRAAELLSRLDAAERQALLARSQSAHATAGVLHMSKPTPALAVLSDALISQGAAVTNRTRESCGVFSSADAPPVEINGLTTSARFRKLSGDAARTKPRTSFCSTSAAGTRPGGAAIRRVEAEATGSLAPWQFTVHTAEAGVDEMLEKARTALTKAVSASVDVAEKLVHRALVLAAKHPRRVFYGLLVAVFYAYASHKSNQTLRRSFLARDPNSLKRAQEIFESIRRQRANISPAVYQEVTKAQALVTKALAAA